MTEDFEIESLNYLLGQMDPARRGAFEAELAQDPAAAAAFKECADAYARFACDSAPAEPMSAADHHGALTAILAATGGIKPQPAAARGRVIAWSRFAWPMAAAALLALNLVNFRRPLQPTRESEALAHGRSAAPAESVPAAGESLARSEPSARLAAADGAAAATPEERAAAAAAGGSGSLPVEEARRLQQLGRDYADLQRNHAALRADYDAAVRLLASRAVMDRSAGRLAAMELVDATSYARGERKGLLDIARGILTEPGVVVAETGEGRPDDGEVGVTLGPNDGMGTAAQPYAWAVYDEKDHRGYLNVYNLPRIAADRTMQLWVKPVDALNYQRVGEVPGQLQNGNGSLYYTLAEGAPAPVEILITEEPRGAAPEVPTGPVVLRGP